VTLQPIPLLYTLHSGNLYGTERMALATIQALGGGFAPVIFAPPGPVHGEAARLGMPSAAFDSDRAFLPIARATLSGHSRVVVFSTRVVHSLMVCALNTLYRRRVAHIQMVHGGADEAISYGKKRRLNMLPVTMVAVSAFVRDRLLAHRVNPRRIRVIENFLTDERVDSAPRRAPFTAGGTPNAIVISRLDPIKRIDLLLHALEAHPELSRFRIRIFGRGDDEQALKDRASRSALNVVFEGFSTGVDRALAESDLLIHLCAEEPFGLAVLEAMAARVPVVVPDSGGAGSLVEAGKTGFRFRAGDSQSLAACLAGVAAASPEDLNRVTANASHALATRFSQRERGLEYHALIEELLR
jgi:glycosyltransferase involved in cell wall biosynthesis